MLRNQVSIAMMGLCNAIYDFCYYVVLQD